MGAFEAKMLGKFKKKDNFANNSGFSAVAIVLRKNLDICKIVN